MCDIALKCTNVSRFLLQQESHETYGTADKVL